MPSTVRYIGTVVVLLMLLGACTGLPGATAPAATQAFATVAPAATEAPGSTDAPPAAGTDAAPATAPTSPAEVVATAPASPADRAPTEPAVSTTAPEPTMPPAPTTPPATQVAPVIACTPAALTPAQTEGPYYKANPPESSTLLRPGMDGTKVTIEGYVLDSQCKPVPGARVDFWQADSEGQYDNQGYTLRGYQVADAEGRYTLETLVPGLYPGRTRHIHVKVTPPSGPTLTTQLYFPDEAANASDRIFSPDLILTLEKTADGELGTFNFVVNTR